MKHLKHTHRDNNDNRMHSPTSSHPHLHNSTNNSERRKRTFVPSNRRLIDKMRLHRQQPTEGKRAPLAEIRAKTALPAVALPLETIDARRVHPDGVQRVGNHRAREAHEDDRQTQRHHRQNHGYFVNTTRLYSLSPRRRCACR